MLKITKRASCLLLALTAGLINLPTMAETVKVSQQKAQVEKPAHGQSMQQVEEQYGAPLEKGDAVGEPPITRWRYAAFTVYFEDDKVIHSVAHRS